MAIVTALMLVIGMQGVLIASAAEFAPMSANVWVCADCKTPVSVNEVRKVKETTNIRTCSVREHQSIGCKICDVVYVVETWISCSGCPRSVLQETREEIERNQHRGFAR